MEDQNLIPNIGLVRNGNPVEGRWVSPTVDTLISLDELRSIMKTQTCCAHMFGTRAGFQASFCLNALMSSKAGARKRGENKYW